MKRISLRFLPPQYTQISFKSPLLRVSPAASLSLIASPLQTLMDVVREMMLLFCTLGGKKARYTTRCRRTTLLVEADCTNLIAH